MAKNQMNYDPYREEILELHLDKKFSHRKIGKILTKKYNKEFLGNSIYYSLKRWTSPDNTFEGILEENKFSDKANWDFGWVKTKEGSVFVRNKADLVSWEDFRVDLLKDLKAYAPNFETFKRECLSDPHLLVLDIADLHIGKLATADGTYEEYNSDLAVKRAIDGVEGILSKASGYPLDKIIFVIGNDVLHVDGPANTTTAGTRQDVSGIWYENYLRARNMYIKIIEMLTPIADVEIVFNPSNHDYVSGFMLADSIYCWFRNHPNITFDVGMQHRKYSTYGKNLIGTSHGDGAKMADLPLLMANEAKQQWADTDFRYVYLHHIHHKDVIKFRSGKDYQGVTVEFLRSASAADVWHHTKGYQHAIKAVEGFIHHKEYGQSARLTHLFK